MALTHRPEPGRPVDAPSAACTDVVELSGYNGQPSLMALEIDGTPMVAWLIDGVGEELQVWLYVPVSSAELADLYERRTMLLGEWLRQFSGREVFVGVAKYGTLTAVNEWTLPDAPADRFTDEVLRAMARTE